MTLAERTTQFKTIFTRNYQRLFLYALYVLGNEDDAKDMVSDVFRRVFEHYEAVALDSVDSYLFFSTKNSCFDFLRHQRQVNRFAKLYQEQTDVNIETLDEYDDRLDRIMDIIRTLPEPTRTVMERNYLDDYSYQEVAQQMEMSVNSVKRHVMRGLQTIRQAFNVNYKKGQAPK